MVIFEHDVRKFPWYVWAFTLFGVVGMPLATAIVLRRVGTGLRGLWTVWIGLSWALAEHGAYLADPRERGSACRWHCLARSWCCCRRHESPRCNGSSPSQGCPPGLRGRRCSALSGRVLVVMGTWRPADGVCPPGRLGDVAIGFAAPFVARGASRSRLIWFNIFGILDLVVAVTVGFLAGQGPLQVLHVAPSTLALTELPLALNPHHGRVPGAGAARNLAAAASPLG
jgi:hypothetical protein